MNFQMTFNEDFIWNCVIFPTHLQTAAKYLSKIENVSGFKSIINSIKTHDLKMQ